MRSTPLRFRVECLWNILFEKNACNFSSRMTASDSVSFHVWTPGGRMSDTRRLGGLSSTTVLPRHISRTETRCYQLLKSGQIAAQTSASRGYVLLREHRYVLHEVSRGCGHAPTRVFQTWKRRGYRRCSRPAGKKCTHFSPTECFICSSIRNLYQVLFIILLIAKGAGHGKRQLHKIQLVYMTIQVVRWKRYR